MPSDRTLPEFHLLNEPEPGERGRRILGAVIPGKHASVPFQEFRPNMNRRVLSEADRQEITELWEDVWQNDKGKVSILDFVMQRADEHENNVAIKILSKLKILGKKRVGHDVEITAGEVKKYTIENPGGNMRDVYNNCTPWFREVKKMWDAADPKKELFFVTGVQVCKNLEVSYSSHREKGIGAGAALSNAEVGNPAPGDLLSAEASHSSQSSNLIKKVIEDEIVLAVRYHKLAPILEDIPAGWSSWIRSPFSSKPMPDLKGFKVVALVRGNLQSAFASSAVAPQADFYTLEPLYVDIEDGQIVEPEEGTMANGSAG